MAVKLNMCINAAKPNTKRAMAEALIESNLALSKEDMLQIIMDELELNPALAKNYQSISLAHLMIKAHANGEVLETNQECWVVPQGLYEHLGKAPEEAAHSHGRGSGSEAKEREFVAQVSDQVSKLTDEELNAAINEKFEMLELIIHAVITGDARAAIVTGNGGLGKTFHVEKVDTELGNRGEWIKGTMSAPHLFAKLYEHRNRGEVLLLDDCDAPLFDEDCLQILKSATDTKKSREISYIKDSRVLKEYDCPNKFEFNGSIIIITNVDLEAQVKRQNRLAPHQEALLTRAHYIDVMLRTKRERLMRACSVIKFGMLQNSFGIEDTEVDMLTELYKEWFDKLRDNSLRSVVKMAELYVNNPENFEAMVKSSMFKSTVY